MKEDSYRQCGLRLEPCLTNGVIGPCKHMNVIGWPETNPRLLELIQELIATEFCRKLLKTPIRTGFVR